MCRDRSLPLGTIEIEQRAKGAKGEGAPPPIGITTRAVCREIKTLQAITSNREPSRRIRTFHAALPLLLSSMRQRPNAEPNGREALRPRTGFIKRFVKSH